MSSGLDGVRQPLEMVGRVLGDSGQSASLIQGQCALYWPLPSAAGVAQPTIQIRLGDGNRPSVFQARYASSECDLCGLSG